MLLARLREARKKRAIVGFCKWNDGAGLLFGRVLEVDAREARFELVHPDGTLDEVIALPLRDISRLNASPKYVKRLELFVTLQIPTSKGQTTKMRRTIMDRLRVARRTGECVSVKLREDPRQDYRVLAIDDKWIEIEEYGDDPFVPIDRRLVRPSQVEWLRWRSTGENAVTLAWKSALKRRR